MTQLQDGVKPPRGRPRDPAVAERIVEAATALLSEFGYSRFTIGRVAARSRVPRSTVYTRWAHASALLDELVARSLVRSPAPTGDRRVDLAAMFRADAAWMRSPEGRVAARLLIDATEPDGFMPQRTIVGLTDRVAGYRHCIAPDADDATRHRLELVVASLWTYTATESDAADLDAFGLAAFVLG